MVNSVRHCPNRGRKAIRLWMGITNESLSSYVESDSKHSDPVYMTSQNWSDKKAENLVLHSGKCKSLGKVFIRNDSKPDSECSSLVCMVGPILEPHHRSTVRELTVSKDCYSVSEIKCARADLKCQLHGADMNRVGALSPWAKLPD